MDRKNKDEDKCMMLATAHGGRGATWREGKFDEFRHKYCQKSSSLCSCQGEMPTSDGGSHVVTLLSDMDCNKCQQNCPPKNTKAKTAVCKVTAKEQCSCSFNQDPPEITRCMDSKNRTERQIHMDRLEHDEL